MLLTTLLSLPADLDLANVRLENEALTLVLRSSQTCTGYLGHPFAKLISVLKTSFAELTSKEECAPPCSQGNVC